MIKTWQDGIGASDTQSFDSLFRHYYSRLVRFALQFVHTREAAEEIASDIFVKVWERRSTLQEVRNLEVYLYVAVRNGCINYCEKYSVVHLQLDMHGGMEFHDTANSQKILEMKELMHRLHMAVEQLPEQCRLIFKMVKEDNLSFREVAEILHVSPRTVETQLYRAIKKLKIILSDNFSILYVVFLFFLSFIEAEANLPAGMNVKEIFFERGTIHIAGHQSTLGTPSPGRV